MKGRDLALHFLKKPSERDLQKTIGASSFGSPCNYCVGKELARTVSEPGGNRYWLGARIGTAIHDALEIEARAFYERMGRTDAVLIEEKIVLGELPDYGTITSKPDLAVLDEKTVHDWKTTSREKLKFYTEAYYNEPDPYEITKITDARFTLQKYLGQIMSYARGIVLQGHEIETVSLVFICRDGLTDDDIKSFEYEYDHDYAETVWQRLEALWDLVRNGTDVEELTSAPGCYSCQVSGRV